MSRSERTRKVRNILYTLDDFTQHCFLYLACVFLFRAEIIIGGFVVKELSSDPPSCLVTYITRVDLKGMYSTSPVCSPFAQFFVVYMPEHFRAFRTTLLFQLSNFFPHFDTFSTRFKVPS